MPDLAVIKTGGKQYIVQPGQRLKVEKLDQKTEEEFAFEQTLLVQKDDLVEIGQPLVEGARVKAKVLSQGRGEKILVLKYKPKVRYHKRQGHRQPYTEVQISSIG
jgi:large subunit ribosomal protein L21